MDNVVASQRCEREMCQQNCGGLCLNESKKTVRAIEVANLVHVCLGARRPVHVHECRPAEMLMLTSSGRSCGGAAPQFAIGAGPRPASPAIRSPRSSLLASGTDEFIITTPLDAKGRSEGAAAAELVSGSQDGPEAIVLTLPDAPPLTPAGTKEIPAAPSCAPSPAYRFTPDHYVPAATIMLPAPLTMPSPAGGARVVPLPVPRYTFGADVLDSTSCANVVTTPMIILPPRKPPPSKQERSLAVDDRPLFAARPVATMPIPEPDHALPSMVLPPPLPSALMVLGTPNGNLRRGLEPAPAPVLAFGSTYGASTAALFSAYMPGLPAATFSMTTSNASSAALAAVTRKSSMGPRTMSTMALKPLRSVGRFSMAVDPSRLSSWQFDVLNRTQPDAALTRKAAVHMERGGRRTRPPLRSPSGALASPSSLSFDMSASATFDMAEAMASVGTRPATGTALSIGSSHALRASCSEPAFLGTGGHATPMAGDGDAKASAHADAQVADPRLSITADAQTLRPRRAAHAHRGAGESEGGGGSAPAVGRRAHTPGMSPGTPTLPPRSFNDKLLSKLEVLPCAPQQMIKLMRRGDWNTRGL